VVRGAGKNVKGKSMSADIYDVCGKLIKTVYLKKRSFVWNAGDHPSGIYIVKAKIGNRILQKRITLIK
jgi:hypothetical protein